MLVKKVLNLYAGLGGNRLKWEGVEVTAVEKNEQIAAVYRKYNPLDEIIVGDCRDYLSKNFDRFDFIWSSPPCQSHSKMNKFTRHQRATFPDLRLYEEIIFLQENFRGKWVVENVVPFYRPLFQPQKCGRHRFWANFYIPDRQFPHPPFDLISAKGPIERKKIMDWLGIHYQGNIYYEGSKQPEQVLRNCVHPDIGLHVLNSAYSGQQKIY